MTSLNQVKKFTTLWLPKSLLARSKDNELHVKEIWKILWRAAQRKSAPEAIIDDVTEYPEMVMARTESNTKKSFGEMFKACVLFFLFPQNKGHY